MTRIRANLLLLASGAIWGMGFIAQSTAMGSIGPWTFIGLRFLVATLAMLPLALREAKKAARPVSRSEWRSFLATGMFFFAGMVAQQIGLLSTSVTNAGFLTGLYVVFTPILGILLFRQWPHPVIWPAAATALAGIFLLSGGQLDRLTEGDWLTILCAFFWAVQVTLTGRYAVSSGRPVALAVTQFALSGLIGLFCMVSLEQARWLDVALALDEILYAGVFSGGLAFTIQAIAQRHTTSAQAAIFLSSEAVFAALFGALFLGERIAMIGYAGCVLLFLAMLAVEIVPAMRATK